MGGRDARVYADKHKDAPRPAFEPVLDAMLPALERKLPVAFDASVDREIRRALAIAKEFNLDPIVSRVAPLAEWHDCFEKMERGVDVKAVLEP